MSNTDAAILAIIEALRGYYLAHVQDGLSHEALAQKWFAEQLFPPSDEDVASALLLMEKTQHGHIRMPSAART